MNEYDFEIHRKERRRRNIIDIILNRPRRKIMYIKTKINIESNKIKINTTKEDGIIKRRFTSFFQGEEEFYIDDISEIKMSLSLSFGISHIFIWLFAIFILLSSLKEFEVEKFIYLAALFFLFTLVPFFGAYFKAVRIKLSNKNIVFPINDFKDDQFIKLLKDLTIHNPDIKLAKSIKKLL